MSKPSDSQTSRPLAEGDVVAGRFRITGVVGKGAMGAVHAAEHVATGQRVALKFMIVGDEEGVEFVSRFEQEARVMAGLRHPNTIRIYDFGRTDDGSMFMAMELLVGQPLDKVIRDATRRGETMAETDAVNYGVQCLKSLGEAHGHGLVHRDLKPGNVFLTDDGGGETLVKVLDFGIARVQGSSLTNAGRILGTPSYMSPEQWQGGKVDARADLYAMGCLLYCCVTGQPPFAAGDNMLSLLSKHCYDPVPDPRPLARGPLSDAFVQVMLTALAKEASDRFADARAMRTALEAVAGGAWAGTPARLAQSTAAYAPGLAPTVHAVSQPSSTGPTKVTVVAKNTAAAYDAQATVALDEQAAMARALLADGAQAVAAEAPSGNSPAVRAGAVVGVVVVIAAAVAWWLAAPAKAPPVAEATAPVAAEAPARQAGLAGAPAAVPAPEPVAAVPVAAPVPAPAPALVPVPVPAAAPVAAAPTMPADSPTAKASKRAARDKPAQRKSNDLQMVD